MKRAWSILISILLGAVVVGMGTGYFLHLANQDRERLANEAQNAKQMAERALNERQQAVDEANQKLAQANQEVNRAQDTIKALAFERGMLTKARPLTPPSRSQAWTSAVSTARGFSVRYPAGNAVTANDMYGLTIAANGEAVSAVGTTSSQPWLAITPYDAKMEAQYNARISSSTEAIYFVNGHLVYGHSGILSDKTTASPPLAAAVLALYVDGTSTQLIWIQDPPRASTKTKKQNVDTWLDVVSTMDFKQ